MIVEVKYVSEAEWIALGSPSWGYTTARIRQYERGTLAYKEVLLEYYRAAILFNKLTKTMNWWEETDEHRLELCRKEIDNFRRVHNLSKGDLGEVDQLIYNAEYSRKELVKSLTHLAREILEVKRKTDKTVTLDSLSKIPANRTPKLEFARPINHSIEEIDGEEKQEDASIQSVSPFACSTHQNYQGLRKPRSGCLGCIRFYNHNKEQKRS